MAKFCGFRSANLVLPERRPGRSGLSMPKGGNCCTPSGRQRRLLRKMPSSLSRSGPAPGKAPTSGYTTEILPPGRCRTNCLFPGWVLAIRLKTVPTACLPAGTKIPQMRFIVISVPAVSPVPVGNRLKPGWNPERSRTGSSFSVHFRFVPAHVIRYAAG